MKTHRFALLLSLVVLGGVGCSSDLSPVQTPPVAVVPLAAPSDSSDSSTIGPAGGTLHISGAHLAVPAGALSQPTLLTMVRQADGSVELGPHGLAFLQPVRLTFTVPGGGDPGQYAVEWFDPDGQEWTTIPSVAIGLTRAAFLGHFSLYKIAPELCD